MKYLLLLTVIIFQGCQEPTLNTVSYKYATCKNKGDVGVRLENGIYQCLYRKGNKIVYAKKKHDFKNPSWINVKPIKKCETTLTEVYKDGNVVCRGKILEVGGKSRVVYK